MSPFCEHTLRSESSASHAPFISPASTFSATAATIQTRTITVEQPANGRIEVNGQVGTSFTFNYGTKVKIELKANTGYTPSALYIATED